MKYGAVLFDVGDTLLTKTPTDFQVFAGRCQEAGISIGLVLHEKAGNNQKNGLQSSF